MFSSLNDTSRLEGYINYIIILCVILKQTSAFIFELDMFYVC